MDVQQDMTAATKPDAPSRRVRSSPQTRRQSEKQADKKRELAEHALSALAVLGFAHVNLRDIAKRSGVGLGVIHYYFEDKKDLLIFCVGQYKDAFALGLEWLIATSTRADELPLQFADALVQSVAEQGHKHRLWYDVRAQALFDPAFVPVVDELERRLVRVMELYDQKLRALNGACAAREPIDALSAYLAVDAVFRYFLQRHLGGDAQARAAMRQRLLALPALLVPGGKRRPR